MLDNPCWLLLLHVPILWLSGLPGPPEDSLKVPREVGLLGTGAGTGASFPGADIGSKGLLTCFGSFLPAMKLPTTTCRDKPTVTSYL